MNSDQHNLYNAIGYSKLHRRPELEKLISLLDVNEKIFALMKGLNHNYSDTILAVTDHRILTINNTGKSMHKVEVYYEDIVALTYGVRFLSWSGDMNIFALQSKVSMVSIDRKMINKIGDLIQKFISDLYLITHEVNSRMNHIAVQNTKSRAERSKINKFFEATVGYSELSDRESTRLIPSILEENEIPLAMIGLDYYRYYDTLIASNLRVFMINEYGEQEIGNGVYYQDITSISYDENSLHIQALDFETRIRSYSHNLVAFCDVMINNIASARSILHTINKGRATEIIFDVAGNKKSSKSESTSSDEIINIPHEQKDANQESINEWIVNRYRETTQIENAHLNFWQTAFAVMMGMLMASVIAGIAYLIIFIILLGSIT